MAISQLTERQIREREFYEEYSRRTATKTVCFDAVNGSERRPWNSYWYVMELAKRYFTSDRQRLLDFGCGPGSYSILYSKIGYEVFGFDLCPTNVSIARELAAKYGMASRSHFTVGQAEKLDYESDYFDIIIGVDILHHVNINQAIAECGRVLKKNGVAIFHEPLRVPAFDQLRETRFGRWVAPQTPSYDRHVTEDERKLVDEDIESIKKLDPNLSIQRFLFTSRLKRFFKSPYVQPMLERLDWHLFKHVPALNRYGGIGVMTLIKK